MSGANTSEGACDDSTVIPFNLIANADAQSGSPLFTVFPAEIRAEIFALALRSFSDESKQYPFDSYWYRPGHTAPRRTELSLLTTCKRVYEEASKLIWKESSGNNEEAFWWGSTARRPPEYKGLPYARSVDENYDDVYDEDHDGMWDDVSWDGNNVVLVEELDEESGNYVLEDEVDGSGEEEVSLDESPTHQNESAAHPPEEDASAAVSIEEGPGDAIPISSVAIPGTIHAHERHIEDFLDSLSDVKRQQPDSPLQSTRQRAFTPAQWSKIRGIHIFPQMYAFSSRGFIRTFIQAKGLRPRTVKVTIRYTDCLASIVPEVDAYYFPESVDSFVIELESAEHKVELEGMVKEVLDDKKRWRWKRLDDVCLELDEDAGVKEWDWMGTTTFGEQKFAHHPEGDKMRYIVKVLTFSAMPTEVKWDGTPFERALAIKNYEASLKTN
ncbi:hypothetical protein BKA70DRAFT_1480013 [Coprinopsis sp. MPI-PUGE-AT-0042]|nr:hypothetical protein BKA70DRAFT_1480013 [Coprinopsis sp. MPI-PUGE-AT-0042]